MTDENQGASDTFKQATDQSNVIIFYIDKSADPNVPDNWKRTTVNDILFSDHANPLAFLEKNNARMPTERELHSIKNAPWRSEMAASDLTRFYWSSTETKDWTQRTQRPTESKGERFGYRSSPVKPPEPGSPS